MPATIPPEAHRLLDEPNFAHLATVMADGSPQVTPVWVARDGDVVLVNTVKGRLKHRNMTREPRVALSVADPQNPYSYLQVRGRVEMTEEGAAEDIDRMSHKYLGKDYPFHQPGDVRVIVRVIPEQVQFQG